MGFKIGCFFNEKLSSIAIIFLLLVSPIKHTGNKMVQLGLMVNNTQVLN